jgi:hypothetical protein
MVRRRRRTSGGGGEACTHNNNRHPMTSSQLAVDTPHARRQETSNHVIDQTPHRVSLTVATSEAAWTEPIQRCREEMHTSNIVRACMLMRALDAWLWCDGDSKPDAHTTVNSAPLVPYRRVPFLTCCGEHQKCDDDDLRHDGAM